MTQNEAMHMSNEQAVQILKPMRDMMCDQHGCPISDAYFAIEKAIHALSTVSPDEVRGVGKWEMWEDYYGSNVYKCSVCGSDWDMIEGTPQDNDFKYCPNCGARMGGVQDALS